MTRNRLFIAVIMVLLVPFLFAGCVDKKQLDRIEDNQSNILTKLENLDKEVKALKVAAPPKRPPVDFNKIYNLPIGSSAIKGKKTAPITITEFSDFQCPYCARVQPTLKQVLKAYPDDVKLVYKDFPLSFHKQAKNAAKAARAAGEQGKYWEMHDLIFKDFNKLTDDSYKQYAADLKIDVTQFLADYNSTKYDKLIQSDINLGRASGVTGTPTLFVDGKRMQRRSFDDFKTRIEEIKKAKAKK